MYNYVNLLVYNKDSTSLGQNVYSLLKESQFSFNLFNTIEQLLAQAHTGNYHILIVVDTEDVYNKLEAIDLPANICENFLIVYQEGQSPILKFPKHYTNTTLNDLRSALVSLYPISIPDFTQRMVRIELEKLNLSKKYLAFKYIVDIICQSLYINNADPFSTNTLNYIAHINQTSWVSVERDVRHMLTSNWNSNPLFKSTLIKHINPNKDINTKNLLIGLIEYIKDVC